MSNWIKDDSYMLNLLALVSGILAVSIFPTLPPLLVFFPLIALCLLAIRLLRPVACLALGLCWGIYAGQLRLDAQLPLVLEGDDLRVRGEVIDLPQAREVGQRFLFRIDEVKSDIANAYQLPAKVLITAYDDQNVEVGQAWQLVVRLKRPRALVNEGAFDYHRWLLSRGISGTGYIRQSDFNKRIESLSRYPVQRIRSHIRDWILRSAPAKVQGPLLALAVGDNSYISSHQWQLFRATGTGHLMAISGLHIGLVAVFGFVFGRLLATVITAVSRQWLCLRYFPNIFSCLSASAYAALAGFGLPTQRALAMVLLFNIAFLFGRGHQPLRALALAAVVVLVIDPLAGLDMGFWLSFGAVTVLLVYFKNRQRDKTNRLPWLDKSRLFVRAQGIVFIGLLLPLLAFNTPLSLLAPIANLIVIPLISFAAVLPLLIAMVLETLGIGFGLQDLLLTFSSLTLQTSEVFLTWLLNLQVPVTWSPSERSAHLILIAVAIIGVASLLLARGIPGRWLGGLLLIPVLLPSPHTKATLQMTVLDVGQGLAVVVRTPDHTLLYDAGARFSDRFDTGEAVVLAYLRHHGIKHIDTMIISHGDNDHAGGAGAVLAGVRVDKVILGEAMPGLSSAMLRAKNTSPAFQHCDHNQRWEWDGVEFQLIEPQVFANKSDNNNLSCVLLLSIAGQHVLLPGDIEAIVERRLVAEAVLPQPVQTVLAPHHGSNTSSTRTFVDYLQPKQVIFSAAYRSRYGHPHSLVTERYQKVSSTLYNTATDGQVDFIWDKTGAMTIRRLRQSNPRYWY